MTIFYPTWVDLLSGRAADCPHKTAFTFASVNRHDVTITHAQLDRRARAVAVMLRQTLGGKAFGERALLLFQPGLDYLSAFFGCLYAGVVAVPAYPPNPNRMHRSVPRLRSMTNDAGIRLVLGNRAVTSFEKAMGGEGDIFDNLIWCPIEDADEALADLWEPPHISANSLAFLQYTSGSTATPKGVLVSHGNLMANEAEAVRGFGTTAQDTMVSWLPLYHDMGLIGGILHPLYLGAPCTFLSPMDFLRRPVRWLKMISEQRARISGGPDFAYALCAQKIEAAEKQGLDLSCWDIAFNGAEPVRAQTLDAFAAAFEPYGFKREALHPCYGLAEATLFVCSVARGAQPQRLTVDADEQAAHRLIRVKEGRELVSSGRPNGNVRIADPLTGEPLANGLVGEIWLTGPSVAGGYFRRKDATKETFDAYLTTGEGPFLRTGDLGAMVDGALFVTGRCKDLIIIRGRNHYPQDIELTVEAHNAALPAGRGAAFAIPHGDGEALAVVWEVTRHFKGDLDEVIDTIREAVFDTHECRVQVVALIKTGTIPKTSSGKIQRGACRQHFLDGTLALVKQDQTHTPEHKPAVSSVAAIRAELTTAPDARTRQQLLLCWLKRTVAEVLKLPIDQLQDEKPLASLGLDSLAAVEVQHQVETQLSLVLPIDNFFDGGTLHAIARTLLFRLDTPTDAVLPIEPQGNPLGHHPLSHGQQALWFHTRLRPESAAYNISRAMTLLGEIDTKALRAAFESLVARHPMLRTTLEMVKGEAFQQVHRKLVPRLIEVDATCWSEDQLHTYLVTEAHRPFGTGHLLRLHLIHRPDHEFVLQLTMHHACVDFWSLALIMHEIGISYKALRQGREVPLNKPSLRYTDYIHWQQQLLESPRGEELWQFWQNLLPADPPVLDMPTDFPRPAELSERGAFYHFYLPARLIRRVKRLAVARETTLHTVLLSTFAVLLHRYGGQDSLVVGSPSMGRTRAGLADVVGYFVNPLPLPARFYAEGRCLSFAELLEDMKRICMAALAHGDYPFPLMVERLQPKRNPAYSPVFQAMFVYQSTPPYGQEGLSAFALGEDEVYLNLDGLEMESYSFEHKATPFDLTLVTGDTGSDRLRFTLEYSMDLFTRASIERLATRYGLLLEGIVADLSLPVDRLPFLSETERHHLLVHYNETRHGYDLSGLMHQRFEEQAALTPEAGALVCKGAGLTYRQLNMQADRLAAHLQALGVIGETRVGVLMERRVEMIVSMLAVLKAGGAYVPLDPAYPDDRLEHMIHDAAAPVILTAHSVQAAARLEARVVYVDQLRLDAGAATQPIPPPIQVDQLAYLIYTSGSTGKPKAVSVTHRNAMALLSWARSVYTPQDLSGVLAATSICFDLSVFEIFLPLSVGGTIFLVENVLACAGMDRGNEITLVNTVPSAAAELVHGAWLPPRVRVINLAGEPLSRSLVDELYKQSSAQRVYDLYGPSEDTTYSTYALRTPGGPVIIGRPIHNTEVYLLDKHLNPVALGLPGELYLAGDGLTRGYLNHPVQTAAHFVPHPLSQEPGKRLYRTGDLARYRPRISEFGGMPELVYLGRADRQVKVRGFRVEPGEIETTLMQHEAVARAVIVTDARKHATNLTAYVVFEDGVGATSVELSEHLKHSLPDYMIPGLFITMETLPVLPNGKLDVAALPAPASYRAASYVAPRDVREATMRDIWADVLGLPRVGVEDNFFELGGHSLSATRIVSRIRLSFGVELPLRLLFETPTVAGLASHIFEIDEDALPPLRPNPDHRKPGVTLPLSFAQQRLWFLDRLEGPGPTYNVPVALRLDGPLNLAAMETAFNTMALRHDSLRTTFVEHDGEPFQMICVHTPYNLPLVDLTNLPPTRIEEELKWLMGQHGRKVFDLARGPLISVMVLRLAADTHVLLVNQHHIITDGWSLGVMVEELKAYYTAEMTNSDARPAPLPVQYADFTLWQRSWLHGDLLEQEVAWWREELDGAPDVLPLPTDRQRPIVQSFEGAQIAITLDLEVTQKLNSLAQNQGVTLFMVLLAAYADFLSRYSHKDDLTVGFPVAGRNRAELENLLGFFINTLVIRVDLRSGDNAAISLADLLQRVRESALGAWAHQNVPFERLVDELRPERDTSHSPLFQVMFALQNTPMEAFMLPGLDVSLVGRSTDQAKFDLSLDLREVDEGLEGYLEYNTMLFEAATAKRMHRHLMNLIRAYAALADTTEPLPLLPNISLLDQGERKRLLYAWNDTVEAYPGDDTVHGLYQARAVTQPGAVAAVFDEESLTFQDLDERANQMAHHLRRMGVDCETVVGLCLGRSPEMLISLLGILKAGGAYLPMDPGYPPERLIYMVQDAGITVLITRADFADPGFGKVPRLYVDEALPHIETLSRMPLNLPIYSDHPIHLHYTSGSTGKPKGVLGTHRGALNRFNWMWRVYPFEPDDLCVQKTALSFADAVWEIFGPALAGKPTVYVADDVARDPLRLMARLEEAGVTRLVLVPSLLESFMNADPDWATRLAKIGIWVTSGEALPPDLCYRFYRENPDALLLNLYGASEVSADITAYETRMGLSQGRVPIGHAIDNTRIYITGPRGELCPSGVPGELQAGGAGLGRGYLGRPALTAEKFVPDPYSSIPGERLYRTGDLAKRLPDGTLLFCGRIDHQVKIRGFRIELGEIESVLAATPGVAGCVVLATDDKSGGHRLSAFVVPAEEEKHITTSLLRGQLSRALPDYMVPATITILPDLPLTPNGKLDRQALNHLAEEVLPLSTSVFAAPRNPTENLLCGIWVDILMLDRPIGVHDNFFELGGHSLTATRVVSRVRQQMGTELSLQDFFRAPTVAALARIVGPTVMEPDGIPIRPRPEEGSFTEPLSYAQQRLWFLHRVEPDSSRYNMPVILNVSGLFHPDLAFKGLKQIAARHETLRTTFIQGDQDQPLQRISSHAQVTLNVVDLSHMADVTTQVQHHIREEISQPFDPAEAPPWRVLMLCLGENRWVVVFNMHHIISDGWSMSVLTREFTALYGALYTETHADLRPMSVQYADYARWQRERLHEDPTASLGWWRARLVGAPSRVALKPDRVSSHVRRPFGELITVMQHDLVRRLKSLGHARNATLYMTLLAGFKLLMMRVTGQTDVVIGSPLANRNHSDIEHLIGFFVNTVVLRTDMTAANNFCDLLSSVRDTTMGAYAHQDVPFNYLVEKLAPQRDLSGNPLFNIMFALQNMPEARLKIAGVTMAQVNVPETETRFDLSPTFTEKADGSLTLHFQYDAGRFNQTTIERLSTLYHYLLDEVTVDANLPLHAYNLCSPEAKETLLASVNQGPTPYPSEESIASLFNRQAQLHPERTALVSGDDTLSYRDLNQHAEALACLLLAEGLQPEETVAIAIPRSIDMLVGLLAVLKAGGAYLGLDHRAPVQRINKIVTKSRTRLALYHPSWPCALPDHLRTIDITAFNRHGDVSGTLPQPIPQALAYISFTSGSTGEPKGVAVKHTGVLRLVYQAGYLGIAGGETMLFSSALAFDASTLEIWSCLLNGGSLVLLPPEEDAFGRIGALIEEKHITWVHLTAGVFRLVAEEQTAYLGELRHLATGGDAASPQHFQTVMRACPQLSLYNCYGPTETTVLASVHPVENTEGPGIPIGKPINNTSIYLLDAQMNTVAAGLPAEVYVGGPGLARGYVCEPAMTAARFVPNPFVEGERLYRTGDLARYLADFSLDFLGRVDHQVKIRGFRIEPGEIQAALCNHPAVSEAVVLPWRTEQGERRLVGYLLRNPDYVMEALAEHGQEAQIEGWRGFFDRDIYGEAMEDPTVNISGWISVYDNEPIPPADMVQWLNDAAQKLENLQPRRILELGCGTGMFFFRLAPNAHHYTGLDIAQAALDHIQSHRNLVALDDVNLYCRAAHQIADLPKDYDLVLLNSVVQYFPRKAYLDNLLHLALNRLAPGGTIFLGDIRHYGLLPHLKADVTFFNARESERMETLRAACQDALDQESELLVHPDAFYRLLDTDPRISHVSVLLKSGEAFNELTCFRYDVVMYTGDVTPIPVEPLDWLGTDPARLAAKLQHEQPDLLAVVNIPNARTARPAYLLDLLHDLNWRGTRGAAWSPAEQARFQAIDPQHLLQQAADHGYHAHLFLPPGADPHTFAVVYHKQPGLPMIQWPAGSLCEDEANRPMKGARERELAAQIHDDLCQRLPEYMVPDHLNFLPVFPRTPGGKVDRSRLPDPRNQTGVARSGHVPPVTETQTFLAAVWCDLLEVRRVGRDDSFFDLGGHSLLATRVVSRIRARYGVEPQLRDLFTHGQLHQMAALVDRLTGGIASTDQDPEPVAFQRPAKLPLSFAQQRLWFLDRLEGPSTTYTMPAVFRLSGKLHPQALEAALDQVLARHEILRTTFEDVAGHAFQVVRQHTPFVLPYHDLTGLSPEVLEQQLEQEITDWPRTIFNLETGPLLAVRLLSSGHDEHLLMMNMHHIISDGWSMGVFMAELRLFYNAAVCRELPRPAELPLQYADYTLWQRKRLQGDRLADQADWWRHYLEGAPELLELPTDYPRPVMQTFAGGRVPLQVNASITEALKRLARNGNATLFMVLAATFAHLLSRYSGSKDICLGTPVAGRDWAGLEGLIGFFVNTLVLRVDLGQDVDGQTLTAQRLVARVQESMLGALAHQDIPFEKLVDEINPERDLSHAPLFQVMIALQNAPAHDFDLEGPVVTPIEQKVQVSRFDLFLNLEERDSGLQGYLEYSTALFKPETAARIGRHFCNLAAAFADGIGHGGPAPKLADLCMLAPAERRHLLETLNDNALVYDQQAGIHSAVLAHAAKEPHAVAVVDMKGQLTYGRLIQSARRIQRELIHFGVGPEDRIGIMVERGNTMVVAVLAALMAGGTYVPLDPNYPQERLTWLIDDAACRAVICTAITETLCTGLKVRADRCAQDAGSPLPMPHVRPQQTAYLIYTSGSTGKPKGVAISHGNAVSLIAWAASVYKVQDLAGVLASTSLNFDLSVFELFLPLSQGGTVYVTENAQALVHAPWKGQLTLINSVPSAVASLLHSSAIPCSVRVINMAGEFLNQDLVEALYRQTPVDSVYDLYGPSESTTYATGVLRQPADKATIGQAIANTSAYVLGDSGQPQPTGVHGELYLSGHGLARGYHGRPGLTASRFLPHPFSRKEGSRMYRTGDRVMRDHDDRLIFLGRMDHQIKLRGFRIEPGEVEVALGDLPEVLTCAVLADTAHQRLVAFLVLRVGNVMQEPAALKARLAKTLPEYMIPTVFIALDAMPQTLNGKLDRKVLDALMRSHDPLAVSTYHPPRNHIEETLCAIWADVLDVRAPIGIHDNFFDLGGHSLSATRIVSQVRLQLEGDLPLKALFRTPTVAELTTYLGKNRAATLIPQAARLPDSEGAVALPLSFAQERLWFLYKATPLSSWYNMPTGLVVRGSFRPDLAQQAFQMMAARHETLRTTFRDEDGSAMQVIAATMTPELRVIDLMHVAKAGERARQLGRAEAATPFKLDVGPLWRVLILCCAPDNWILVFTMHHIISDGWSMSVLTREFTRIYAALATGIQPALSPMPIQYGDFAVWQRSDDALEIEQQLQYWCKRLQGAPVMVDLKPDFIARGVNRPRGEVTLEVDPILTQRLTALGRKQGASLYMVLLAAFKVLLQRLTGMFELVVGSPVANRNRADIEHLIGFFVNTIVIRTTTQSDASFNDMLEAVREAAMEAYEHQDLPFNRLVEELAPERSAQGTPLFNIMFSLQNMPSVGLRMAGVSINTLALIDQDTKFDLSPTFIPTEDGGLQLLMEYDAGRFAKVRMQQLIVLYRTLLLHIPERADQPAHSLRLMSERESMAVVLNANRTIKPYPDQQTIYDRFQEIAASNERRTALITSDGQLTYRRLQARAEALAYHLADLGLRPEETVAICLPRGVHMIIAMLGILRAGGSYFCPDSRAPEERARYMLRTAGVRFALTNQAWSGFLPLDTLHTLDPCDIPQQQRLTRPGATQPLQTAYISYTSGSTGVPKGVSVPHRGVMRLVCDAGYLGIDRGETMLLSASPAFDAATLEIWGCLLNAGTLVILEENEEALSQVGRIIQEHDITWAHLTAAIFRLVVDEQLDDLAGLKGLATGGEAASPQHFQLLQKAYPKLAVYNCYGPTETTVLATNYRTVAERKQRARIPIGLPIDNTTIYLLDRDGQPVEPGLPGEITVGGPGLARGYLGQAAQTAERFLPNAFSSVPGERLYQTGDLARFRPDGPLEFLGRVDHQVKIRGFRIEPGDIQTVLERHEAVREAVVIPWQGKKGEQRLAAYVLIDPLFTADGLDRDEMTRITNWQHFFDRDLYAQNADVDDPRANFNGWISVYDDTDIPLTQMQQWLDDTISKIQVLKPRRILEAGCGTGMFLFRLAPTARRYLGLDIAAGALQHIEKHRQHPSLAGCEIALYQRAAHELADLPCDFDLVLLNSVIQYFPDVAYTDALLTQALTHLIPGGAFFLGDIRHFGLLTALKADVVTFKASPRSTADALRVALRNALDQESELLLHPDYFYSQVVRGRFTHVEVLLKEGEAHNELTCFRYDVRLHTAPMRTRTLRPLQWQTQHMTLEKLRKRLGDKDLVAVTNVPNARTARAVRLQVLLEDHSWQGDRKHALSEAEAWAARAVDPQDLADLARELGLHLRLMHAPGADPNTFSAVFSTEPHIPVRWPCLEATAEIPRHLLANQPLKGVRHNELAAGMRQFMADHLPDYLIPDHLDILDSFPRTAGGKVDRKRLPEPSDLACATLDAAPETETEQVLALIWQELLDRPVVGRNANFFQLGGHSLMAVRLLNRIQKECKVRLSVSTVFQQPTLTAMADAIVKAGEEGSCLARLNTHTNGDPWVVIHPAGGQAHWYLPLAQHLDVPTYGLESPALKGGALFTDIQKLAAHFLQTLGEQGMDPAFLLGWSLGGPIAFEMARQLAAQGKTPACVVLVDSFRTQPARKWDETTRTLVFLHDLMSEVSEAQRRTALSLAESGDTAPVLFAKLREQNVLPDEWDTTFLNDMFRIYQANLGMAINYQPSDCYHGKVILIRALDNVTQGQTGDQTNGWGDCCTGDLQVVDMPGDHYSLLGSERVGRLAKLLKRTMAVKQ